MMRITPTVIALCFFMLGLHGSAQARNVPPCTGEFLEVTSEAAVNIVARGGGRIIKGVLKVADTVDKAYTLKKLLDTGEEVQLSRSELNDVNLIQTNKCALVLSFLNPTDVLIRDVLRLQIDEMAELRDSYFFDSDLGSDPVRPPETFSSEEANLPSYADEYADPETRFAVEARLEARDLNGQSGVYIRLDRGKVYPEDLGSTFEGGSLAVVVELSFTTDTEGQGLTYRGLTTLSEFTSSDGQFFWKAPSSLEDAIRNRTPRIDVYIRDRGASDDVTLDTFNELRGVVSWSLSEGGVSASPSKPSLTVDERPNALVLEYPSTGADEYQIYRSTKPSFSVGPETLIATTSESLYADSGLLANQTYHYRIVGVSEEGLRSAPSDEQAASIAPAFQFSGVSAEREVVVGNAFSIAGSFDSAEGEAVSGATVTARIPRLDWTSASTTTDENGEFELEIRAPTLPDAYDIELEGRTGVVTRTPRLSLVTTPPVESRYDVQVTSLTADSLFSPGDAVDFAFQIENTGSGETNTRLEYRLLDAQGVAVVESDEVLVLGSGAGQSVAKSVVLPTAVDKTSYLLEVEATSLSGDKNQTNDIQRKAIYVEPEPFSAPTYQTATRGSVGIDSTVSYQGVSVTPLEITSSSVSLRVNGENIGPLSIAPDPASFWESAELDAFVQVVSADAALGVASVEIGAPLVTSRLSPQRVQTVRGQEGALTMSVPSSQTVDPASVEIFGRTSDVEQMANWRDGGSETFVTPNTYRVFFATDRSADLRIYESWIRWQGESSSFVSRFQVRLRPVHDLRLSGGNLINTDGEDRLPSFFPGGLLQASVEVENDGDFAEKVILGAQLVQVSSERVLLSDSLIYSASSGDSRSAQFLFPTVGLPTGAYEVHLNSPHDEDLTPASTILPFNLEAPVPVEVAIEPPGQVYNPGTEIPISVQVTDRGISLSDAEVSATIVYPTGSEEERTLSFNGAENRFLGSFAAERGGNYTLMATASRPPYLSGTDTMLVQTFVDVGVHTVQKEIETAKQETVVLSVENGSDLYGSSADLSFDASRLGFDRAVRSPLLTENGDVDAALFTDETNGAVTVGISRLDPEARGASTYRRSSLFAVNMHGRQRGEAEISLENVQLSDSQGRQVATRIQSGTASTVISEDPSALLITTRDTSQVADIDTAYVELVDAYLVHSIDMEIGFDPSVVEVIGIREMGALSRDGTDQTVFADGVDNESGRIHFAVSRTGVGDAGVSISASPVAAILYRGKTDGDASFSVETGDIRSSVGEVSLPFVGNAARVRLEGSSEASFPTLEVSPTAVDIEVGEATTLVLQAADIPNLYSFAVDVAYDPEVVRVESVNEGSALSQSGVQTSFTSTVDNSGGSVVAGGSRLGDVSGVDTGPADTLFTLDITRLSDVSSEIQLLNTGLLESDGSTQILHDTESGYLLNTDQSGLSLRMSAYLSGAYEFGQMTTNLNDAGLLPLQQPYGIAPWNYDGGEAVSAQFFVNNPDIVDWILVELWPTEGPATSTTPIARQSAFVTANGEVISLSGSALLPFPEATEDSYVVAVQHRNHLPMISRPLTVQSGLLRWDASTSSMNVVSGTLRRLDTSLYGLLEGDVDASRGTTTQDLQVWRNYSGPLTDVYTPHDLNLDGVVDDKDLDNWRTGSGRFVQY